jgi:pyruvate kinase
MAVLMMAETCYLAESAICYPPLYDELRLTTSRPTQTVETVAMAAVGSAQEQNAGAILVLSTSGNTARLISKFRPNVPIITGKCAVIRFKSTSGKLTLSKSRGISKLLVKSTYTVVATRSGTLSPAESQPKSGRLMLITESGKQIPYPPQS